MYSCSPSLIAEKILSRSIAGPLAGRQALARCGAVRQRNGASMLRMAEVYFGQGVLAFCKVSLASPPGPGASVSR